MNTPGFYTLHFGGSVNLSVMAGFTFSFETTQPIYTTDENRTWFAYIFILNH